MYDNIHREEAQSTDHDKSIQELTGIAPPCDECGKAPVLRDNLCKDCHPDS